MEKNYLVIDLEMCKVEKFCRKEEFRQKLEIIQIGAVLLDEEYREISRFNTYVKPEYGYIDWFIEDLTGISGSDVKHAPVLQDALGMLFGWLNGREVTVFAWSDSDYKQLRRETKSKKIASEALEAFLQEDRWVDYQHTFGERFEMGRCVSLKEAMNLADLEVEGREHNGLEDAINTGRLIAKLEKNPDYQLPEIYERARREEKPTVLSFSMGSLFEGIKLELPA